MDLSNLREKSIFDLFNMLSTAIMLRYKYDRNFDYIGHKFDPKNYRPITPDELAIWEELTHPLRRDDLLQLPIELTKKFGKPTPGNYFVVMYDLLLEASRVRY